MSKTLIHVERAPSPAPEGASIVWVRCRCGAVTAVYVGEEEMHELTREYIKKTSALYAAQEADADA